MNAADALDAGAQQIELVGWAQNNGKVVLDCERGPFCAQLGIHAGTPNDCIARIDAWFVLGAYLQPDGGLGAIWAWNDAPGRTAEEVTSTMRAAAVVWRAQNQPNPVPAGAQEFEIRPEPISGRQEQAVHTE